MSIFLSEVLRGSLSHKTHKEGDNNNFQDHARCNSRGKSQTINTIQRKLPFHHRHVTMDKVDHYMNA